MSDRREAGDVRVTDNPDAHRYEAFVDDELAGYIVYDLQPRLITLLHTEVEPTFEGRGVASRLVSATLEDIRSRDLELRPICAFVRAYIARHPEYEDLVAAR